MSKNDDAVSKKDLATLQSAIKKDIEEVVSGAVQEVLGVVAEEFSKRDKKLDKIDVIEATVNRTENKLDATVDHVDDLEVRIKHLEHKNA